MMTLVTGGSASQKSEFAEQLILEYGEGDRIYLATMRIWDDEGRKRVLRHQKMRKAKQFTTLECCTDLIELNPALLSGKMVLLECMSNLAANELFEVGGSQDAVRKRILQGIRYLHDLAVKLVVVTNEVFSDDGAYDIDTIGYLKLLGLLNQELAAMADQVVEIVYGIPVWLKNK